MSGHILTEFAGGIARIQISRPEKKNALTLAMYAEIADALERAAARRTCAWCSLTASRPSSAAATMCL
jgi:enoyl-CoA hydratase/carnithine racemase